MIAHIPVRPLGSGALRWVGMTTRGNEIMMLSKKWMVVSILMLGAIAQAQALRFPGGFVNSASFVGSGAIARGELVTIFGTNLSNSTVFIPLDP